jgi:hypothetical protein
MMSVDINQGYPEACTSPGFMTTRTRTPKPGPPGTAVLEQLAELDVESISPATARKLLEFRFAAAHHARVKALSRKAQLGTLSPAEHQELDEYIRVGALLSILQSRARRVLKDTGPTP